VVDVTVALPIRNKLLISAGKIETRELRCHDTAEPKTSHYQRKVSKIVPKDMPGL
jgi:hypothetical protein